MEELLDTVAEALSESLEGDLLPSNWTLLFYDRVSSTMDVSREFLASGRIVNDDGRCLVRRLNRVRSAETDHGNVYVVALSQSAGRGREGRSWVSDAGSGVYLTVGLCLAEHIALSGLSLAIGVGVARAAERLGVLCRLKWPNDVVVWDGGWRKLSGVLVETVRSADQKNRVSIGIGLNISRGGSGFPDTATSLTDHLTTPITYHMALETLSREVFTVLSEFYVHGFSRLCGEWNRWSCVGGAQVLWSGESNGEERRFRACEAVEDGGLLIEDEVTGERRIAYSGEIHLREVYRGCSPSE